MNPGIFAIMKIFYASVERITEDFRRLSNPLLAVLENSLDIIIDVVVIAYFWTDDYTGTGFTKDSRKVGYSYFIGSAKSDYT